MDILVPASQGNSIDVHRHSGRFLRYKLFKCIKKENKHLQKIFPSRREGILPRPARDSRNMAALPAEHNILWHPAFSRNHDHDSPLADESWEIHSIIGGSFHCNRDFSGNNSSAFSMASMAR